MYLKEFSETIAEERGSMWYLGRGEYWQNQKGITDLWCPKT